MKNSTIVAFHIGRGGSFHNPGYLSYIGEREIRDFVNDLFIGFENEHQILKKIGDRSNLIEKYYECKDNEDFTWFKDRLNMDTGELVYLNSNGNEVGLTYDECETGVGTIDIDGDYNTTYCKLLSDCSEKELQLVYEGSYDWSNIKKESKQLLLDNYDVELENQD